ncbi:MAG TPA: riboflavin transporter RibU, partial [Ruminococcaceae bacterium]|nr:riboflavin transporter RibU [Oscillospiraceae bacterium]
MVLIGLFAAISIILYFLEIPFFSAYLKIDFSDLPAALAAILFGPLAGILIELIKNIIFFI